MADKFNPEDKNLQPISRLLERAEVTADDIQKANDNIRVANMTELEAKDAKIKALEDKVYELETQIKSLISLIEEAKTRKILLYK